MIAENRIHAILADIFSDVFLRDDIAISNALSARDVEEWDSFKHIEIIMASEAAFGVKFTSAELDRLSTLGDMVKIIIERGKLPD